MNVWLASQTFLCEFSSPLQSLQNFKQTIFLKTFFFLLKKRRLKIFERTKKTEKVYEACVEERFWGKSSKKKMVFGKIEKRVWRTRKIKSVKKNIIQKILKEKK